MTTTPDTAPRRRRRAVIAAITAGVLVIVGAAVLYVVTRQQDSTPTPGSPAATFEPTTSASAVTASSLGSAAPASGLADGCLGGPDPFAAILPAQTAATHDLEGAAAFARTFGRWSVTYPIDPAAPQVLGAIVAEGNPFEASALDGLNELARNLQSQGYTESKTIADQGAYRISPVSTDTRADLDLILYRQLTRADGRAEEMKMAISVLLERTEDGPWFISGTLPVAGSDPFAPSDTVPWLAFEGAC